MEIGWNEEGPEEWNLDLKLCSYIKNCQARDVARWESTCLPSTHRLKGKKEEREGEKQALIFSDYFSPCAFISFVAVGEKREEKEKKR